jgi:hypothetical protein
LARLAGIQHKAGKSSESAATLREILAVDAAHVETRKKIVDLEVELGSVPNAIRELREIVRIYLERGDSESAVASQRSAMALQPE